jgi:hypothetical protein
VSLAARRDTPGGRASPTAKTAAWNRPRARLVAHLLLLDEPLAGMSPRERVETVEAR